jgi:hypothetical protein
MSERRRGADRARLSGSSRRSSSTDQPATRRAGAGNSRTGLQPCYQVLCGLGAPGGVTWNPFRASHGGKMAAAREATDTPYAISLPSTRTQASPCSPAPGTAGSVHRDRWCPDRGRCRRWRPTMWRRPSRHDRAWSGMPVTPRQPSPTGSSSWPTSPAMYSSTSHRQGAASMPADGSAIAHATWRSLGVLPCGAEHRI